MRCPICRHSFEIDQTTTMPFCGPRCRAIDLGRWFDERYHVTDPGGVEVETHQEDTIADSQH